MSQIIQEMADQSTEDIMGVKILNKEKFAMLILKECIDICRSEDWEDQQGWGKMYAHKIQKQFGIKL